MLSVYKQRKFASLGLDAGERISTACWKILRGVATSTSVLEPMASKNPVLSCWLEDVRRRTLLIAKLRRSPFMPHLSLGVRAFSIIYE